MDVALMFGACLLGLAGIAHCAAMCGAACVAVGGAAGNWASAGFQAGRLVSYSLAGAVAAASVGTLGQLGQWTPVLRPLWIGVHLAAFALGAWLLWRGVQPRWVSELALFDRARGSSDGGHAITWSPARRTGRAGVAGLAWVLLPCGLLQSALVMAALGNSALAGASVMAAFALASSPGLMAAPWLLRALGRFGGGGDAQRRLLTRLSGVLLAAASGWALTHGLWERFLAWCFA
jgi:uncharacterized protein